MEGRPLDDTDLVERSRQGDGDAYGTLVQRYQGIAFRAAYLVTRSAAEAEDAVQEGFVKAFYALGRFREGGAFKPWLLRIVVNEARNRRRAAGRRENLRARASREPLSGDAAPSPEAAALAADDAQRVLDAVSALGDADRLVLTYRYWLGLNEREMAQALSCARGTVKSRLNRALRRLRALLPDAAPSFADVPGGEDR
ncbi:MAG: sigma-70 family RNA polymerase sigma factor [Actinomycetota bacterium]|nr:sigma-70 family RNA polymerase sigma factor [Actinomycetota bacterium]